MYACDDSATASHWQRLPSRDQVDAAADSFRMLADPTRLQMLWLLCGGDFDVTTLATTVGIARPAISQHLAKLRLAGLVSTHREGRRAVYRARGAHVRRLLSEALRAAEHRTNGLPDHD
ncbi:MAG TPA: metalloregulator ArsR/SmtB family transcription factor [Pseudonocardiaceae bacterium]